MIFLLQAVVAAAASRPPGTMRQSLTVTTALREELPKGQTPLAEGDEVGQSPRLRVSGWERQGPAGQPGSRRRKAPRWAAAGSGSPRQRVPAPRDHTREMGRAKRGAAPLRCLPRLAISLLG